jgi:hypothetical protein
MAAIEALENKHVEQELGEIDEQKVETKEETIKNATALKHMHRRLSILGENATDDARNRLEDEKYKLNRLEQRQERELQKLLRIQNREKLILQRNQQNELADLTTSMREDHDLKVRHKHEELVKNATKLEALIHERALRLVARWHLQLQILKREEKELSWIKGPLPLSILRLPEEFGPYVSAYH